VQKTEEKENKNVKNKHMKTKILKTAIGIGIGLILFSYIYTSKGYEVFTTTFFLFVFGSLIASMIIYLLFYWLLVPLSKTYTIRKGKNYSGYRFKPFYNFKGCLLEFTLHDSCKVETDGIQKIFGVGDFNQHKYSVRVGFKYIKSEDKFDIFNYYYEDGNPSHVYLFSVEANKKAKVIIHKWKGFGKFLFPYFEQDGGVDNKGAGAPHDMKMTLTIKR